MSEAQRGGGSYPAGSANNWRRALQERSREADGAVSEAVRVHLADRLPAEFAVLAVGGYGRSELFPYSDVDLVILFASEPEAGAIKEPIGSFLRALWDGGFRASQSVRTIAECCRIHEGNFELTISLLDRRLVAGDSGIFGKLEERFGAFEQRSAARILRELAALVRARHAKYENTVFHLEPNIKEGAGGIRDLQFLHWARKLAPDKEAFALAWAAGQEPREFLYAVRLFLHWQAGRDNNALTFEQQDAAAAAWKGQRFAPEEWMREYYRNGRRVFQAALRVLELIDLQDASLVRQFFDRATRLSGDFTVAHNRVYLRNPGISLQSLRSILDVFGYVARHGIALSWDAQRRISERLTGLTETERKTPSWAAWRDLLRSPHAALAVREMQGAGLLAALIPPWHSIECLVVRDYYHRYTVDEHTLVALDAIDALVNGKGPGRMSELACEEKNLASVRFALLLHDVGKGLTPGDHVAGSRDAAHALLEAFNTPVEQRAQIEFLIAKHLVLSSAMSSRDPEDPATARLLTSQVPTFEDLRRLTLLTYADISAVNPTAMSQWRLEQLWHIYSVASAQFTRELAADRIHAGGLREENAPLEARHGPELSRFLEGFPTRYLRTHTPEQLQAHFELEKKRLRSGVAVAITRENGAYLMTVLALDQAGLFASLCGALAGFGMNILKAEASSNAARCVLDELRFADPARTLELNPEEVQRLGAAVEEVVKGSWKVSDLLKGRRPAPRPQNAPHVLPAIRFDNEASEGATLIHFAGEDRPGLLYDLASALTRGGCDIELVLVNTEAHRALDVFYVSRKGAKLEPAVQEELRRALSVAAGANI